MRFLARPMVLLTACLLVLGLSPLSRAQSDTQPVDSPDFPILPHLLNVDVQNMTLEDMVDYLRHEEPSLKVVVTRDSDAPQDAPLITLKLKNVTAVTVLQTIPLMFHFVDLHRTDGSQIMLGGRGGSGGGGPGRSPMFAYSVVVMTVHSNGPKPSAAQLRVQVFNLWPLVQLYTFLAPDPRYESNPPRPAQPRKVQEEAAMTNIVSLIQTVLDELPQQGVKADLKIHEPTYALIVRGTDAQIAAVAQTFRAFSADAGGGTTGGGSSSAPAPVKSPTP